ncbi:ABC transporter ATP-binding protein [Halarchaeum sp. P4]|uniref:ABC transporter ATP-binding protein n=1 Tax=Halarchaeum sp. P4 TaxID=3421639 RepID=UPI003EBC9941
MAIQNSTQTGRTGSQKDVVLDIEETNVHFDLSRGTSQVLNDVNLEVERGEILAVVGESGSGKSMFAASILDAVEDPGVTTGDITYYPKGQTHARLDDEAIDVLDLNEKQLSALRWEDISMVFQGAMNSFNPTMKIRTHFEETVRAHDADLDACMEHVADVFDALHLDMGRVLNSYPHELSGGMKQRALIALSLVLEPNVLVMDEPTAALDMLMQRSIISMLRELRDTFDLTIVFVTHDLPLVAGLSDRIAVMYAFEFVEVGPTRELLLDAAHPYTRALLRSVPNVDTKIEEMEAIEGASPDPVNIPQGCSYHPRCPLADDRCEANDPEMHAADPGHEAACYYVDEARETVPYLLHGAERGDAR